VAATRSFAGSTVNIANATSHTYTNHAIGTAAADRYVVVIAYAIDNAAERTINSMTIGGNAATPIQSNKSATGQDVYTAMFGLAVAAGTTATIVVTYSSTMNTGAVAVYALYGLLSTTPFHNNGNQTNAATSVSTTLNIPEGGLAVAGSCIFTNNVNHTGTGLTEDADVHMESNTKMFAMSDEGMTAETGRTLTVTGTTSLQRCISAASWAPATYAPPPFRRRTRFFQRSFYRPDRSKIWTPDRSLILPNSYKKAA
jgi:hypothetical protein